MILKKMDEVAVESEVIQAGYFLSVVVRDPHPMKDLEYQAKTLSRLHHLHLPLPVNRLSVKTLQFGRQSDERCFQETKRK